MWASIKHAIIEWVWEITDPGLGLFTFLIGFLAFAFDSGLAKAKSLARADSFYLWAGAMYMALGLGIWLYVQMR